MTCRLRNGDGAVISPDDQSTFLRNSGGRSSNCWMGVGVTKIGGKSSVDFSIRGFWKILAPDFRRARERRRKSFLAPPALNRGGRRDELMEPAIR